MPALDPDAYQRVQDFIDADPANDFQMRSPSLDPAHPEQVRTWYAELDTATAEFNSVQPTQAEVYADLDTQIAAFNPIFGT